MSTILKKNSLLPLLALTLIVLACIPREEPEVRLILQKNHDLPQILNENSGMIEAAGLIWFMNDGGNEPALYGYNHAEDAIVRTVIVKNTINTDWEDITQNENYIYIGDFGNNAGSRVDLRIIRINKADLIADNDTVTPSGVIQFSYNDQTDFTPAMQATPYDCEALVAFEDSLVLFTKDWLNYRTRLYTLSVTPGLQVAKFRKQWNVNGLITAAAWSAGNQELLLLGYTPFLAPFLWVFSGFTPGNLTYDDGNRTDFSMLGIQSEGLLISGDGSIFVSSEKYSDISSLQSPASLFTVEEQ